MITLKIVKGLAQGAVAWDGGIAGFGVRRQLGHPTYFI
jgi:integrase